MTQETLQLKQKADMAVILYRRGRITKQEAMKDFKPYMDLYNEKAKEKGQKYGIKPKLVTFSNYKGYLV